jgi:hypothetical protein
VSGNLSASEGRGDMCALLPSVSPVDTEEICAVALLDNAAELLLLRRVDVIVIAKVFSCLAQDVDGFDVGQTHVALGPLLELKRCDFVPEYR